MWSWWHRVYKIGLIHRGAESLLKQLAPQPLNTAENKPFSLLLTSMKWSVTQNTCHLQLVGKFKKLKKKLEIRFPLSLLFSYNFCIISSLCLWMETLISDPSLREFLSPSTSHAASFLQKVCGFKNIKPQIWTYTPREVWGVTETGR